MLTDFGKACAARTGYMPFFKQNRFRATCFLLQPKEVGKKWRSMTMLFMQLSGEFSRSFALALGNGKLNLHRCKLPY